MAQKYYTTDELAEIFGVEPAIVHRYLIDHGICFFKDRERYEISEYDIKEWDRKRKKKGAAKKHREPKER
jgi:excisionase family DNA binding protein